MTIENLSSLDVMSITCYGIFGTIFGGLMGALSADLVQAILDEVGACLLAQGCSNFTCSDSMKNFTTVSGQCYDETKGSYEAYLGCGALVGVGVGAALGAGLGFFKSCHDHRKKYQIISDGNEIAAGMNQP